MKHLRTTMLMKEIAQNEGVSKGHVQEIVETIFEFTRHCMSKEADRSKNYFPKIRIPFFGIFYVSDNRLKYLKKLNESKKEVKDESI